MLGSHNSEISSMSVFLSGVVFGIIMGLFFASYLLERGKIGAKNGGKNKSLSHTLPPAKEFSKIIKVQSASSGAASLRTGSTHSGGASNSSDETANFIWPRKRHTPVRCSLTHNFNIKQVDWPIPCMQTKYEIVSPIRLSFPQKATFNRFELFSLFFLFIPFYLLYFSYFSFPERTFRKMIDLLTSL